jgi:hypothetical protein
MDGPFGEEFLSRIEASDVPLCTMDERGVVLPIDKLLQ